MSEPEEPTGPMEPTALFAVKPRYARLIFDGTKQVEFRRAIPRHWMSYPAADRKIWLYTSYPVCAVEGHVTVTNIFHQDIEQLWRACNDLGGIKRSDFLHYFGATEKGYALMLWNPQRLKKRIPVKDLHGTNATLFGEEFRPPQNFYLDFDPYRK